MGACCSNHPTTNESSNTIDLTKKDQFEDGTFNEKGDSSVNKHRDHNVKNQINDAGLSQHKPEASQAVPVEDQ